MREMKDSGIEWIGAMPRAWKMNTIAQIFLQVKCKNTGLQERNLLSLSYGKVKRKSIDTVEGLLPESFDGYNIIEKDDIVLRLTDLQNDHTSLRVGLAEERGIITSAYLTIRNRSNLYINNIEEQRSIVEYLNERCVGIDALIRKKQQYLTEIENYKKSLIYEYVTGKKEVLPL